MQGCEPAASEIQIAYTAVYFHRVVICCGNSLRLRCRGALPKIGLGRCLAADRLDM